MYVIYLTGSITYWLIPCSCFLARHVYNIPDWFHHLLYTARMLFKNTLENYLELYIDHKIETVTQEHRIVAIIHLLRGNYDLINALRPNFVKKKNPFFCVFNILNVGIFQQNLFCLVISWKYQSLKNFLKVFIQWDVCIILRSSSSVIFFSHFNFFLRNLAEMLLEWSSKFLFCIIIAQYDEWMSNIKLIWLFSNKILFWKIMYWFARLNQKLIPKNFVSRIIWLLGLRIYFDPCFLIKYVFFLLFQTHCSLIQIHQGNQLLNRYAIISTIKAQHICCSK